MKSSVAVHVIDDDASFRRGLKRLLEAHGYEVITYDSAEEYILNPSSKPGCVLLDVRMPGLSGLQAQSILTEENFPHPIIFLTGHGDIPMSVQAIKAGAVDFLTKPVNWKTLEDTIENALTVYFRNLQNITNLSNLTKRFQLLTRREAEVFKLVVTGCLNKEIAYQLGAAEQTIKIHRSRVMEKMKATTVAELINMANLLFPKSAHEDGY